MLPLELNIEMPVLLASLYRELMDSIEDATNTEGDSMVLLGQVCVQIAKNILARLREYVIDNPFGTKQEEIFFFKEIKPRFYCCFIYYLKIFQIESRRPAGSQQSEEKYLIKELDKIQDFFEANSDFYSYYRSGASFLDEKYFVRGSLDINLAFHSYHLDSDPVFCSSHDYKVSKILANGQLRNYLLESLERVYHKEPPVGEDSGSEIYWTGPLVWLNELVYALKEAGVFNNGNATLAQIAREAEKSCHVKLKNIYRTQQEIRLKKNPAEFMDFIRKKYKEGMDRLDENPRSTVK